MVVLALAPLASAINNTHMHNARMHTHPDDDEGRFAGAVPRHGPSIQVHATARAWILFAYDPQTNTDEWVGKGACKVDCQAQGGAFNWAARSCKKKREHAKQGRN